MRLSDCATRDLLEVPIALAGSHQFCLTKGYLTTRRGLLTSELAGIVHHRLVVVAAKELAHEFCLLVQSLQLLRPDFDLLYACVVRPMTGVAHFSLDGLSIRTRLHF